MADTKVGEARIARLRKSMGEKGIDVLLCFKPENSFYLSGFNPIVYSHPVIAILPLRGQPTLLVHALRDDHARASAWVSEIRLYGAWSTKVTMGPSWLNALQTVLKELELGKTTIGIEENFLPIGRMRELHAILPEARFADASSVIWDSRLIKEPAEIANARIAARLADIGMTAAIDALGQGGSEREVSIAGMNAMNQAWLADFPDIEVCGFGSLEGGVQHALWCWCMSGERVLINCDNPTTRRPARGEIAIIFIWANSNGIFVESERAVAIGELPAERRRAYDAILEVREVTRKTLRPGVPVREVFGTAKQCYERLGYAKNIPGRLGHGMGLGAHEEPSIDGRTDVVLQPGMMFTFEPNLRLPEWGGLQHSDTVLITDRGAEFLTTTPNGFLQVQA